MGDCGERIVILGMLGWGGVVELIFWWWVLEDRGVGVGGSSFLGMGCEESKGRDGVAGNLI